MERIIDIYGHSAEYDEMYQLENSWFGRVIIGEDQKFEGIVEDFYQTAKYFVFGQVTEQELFVTKCTKQDTDLPCYFSGKQDDGKFYGDYSVKNQYVEIPLGECKMSLLSADKTRDESDTEMRELKVAIAEYKHHLGEIGNTLHKEFEVSRIRGPQQAPVNKSIK